MAEMEEENSMLLVSNSLPSPSDSSCSPHPPGSTGEETKMIEDLTDSLEKMTEAYKTVSESSDSLPMLKTESSPPDKMESMESRYREEKEEMQKTINSLSSQLSSLERSSSERSSLRREEREIVRMKKRVEMLEDELKDKEAELKEDQEMTEQRHKRVVEKLKRDHEKTLKRMKQTVEEKDDEIEHLTNEKKDIESEEEKKRKLLTDKIRRLEQQLRSSQLNLSGGEETLDPEEVEQLKREKEEILEREKKMKNDFLLQIKKLKAEQETSLRLDDGETIKNKYEEEIRLLKEEIAKERASKEEEISEVKKDLEDKINELNKLIESERNLKERIMAQNKKLIEEKRALEKQIQEKKESARSSPVTTAAPMMKRPVGKKDPNKLMLSDKQVNAYKSIRGTLEADESMTGDLQKFDMLWRDFGEVLEYVNLQKKELKLRYDRIKTLQEEENNASDIRMKAEDTIAVLVGVTCNLQEKLEDLTTPGGGEHFVKPIPKYCDSERFVGSYKPGLF